MKLIPHQKLSYKLSQQLLGLHQAANMDPELQVMLCPEDDSCGQIVAQNKDLILIAATELKSYGVIFSFDIKQKQDANYYFELPSTFAIQKLEAFCWKRI